MTMELKQAKALLTELADGVDPLTGECLPADSVCNRPEIIRALHCVLQYVSDRPKRSAPLPNAGKPWTEADEAALMQMFDVGCSMEEMQARFQRTNGAIVRRLERLGRLRPGETIRNPRRAVNTDAGDFLRYIYLKTVSGFGRGWRR